MFSIWQVLGLIGGGALLAVICIVIGGWLTFKASRAIPGEKFLGGVPKGEVFSLPDALDAAEFPGTAKDEQNILVKTERFLEKLRNAGK